MPDPNREKQAERLIDEMLAAQSRFAAVWSDGPLTDRQRRDEAVRDNARDKLMEMLRG